MSDNDETLEEEAGTQDTAALAPEPSDNLPATTNAEGEEIEFDENSTTASDLEAVFDVPVNISAVLGRTHMEVSDLLALNKGTVVELDRKVGEAIDIFVNNRLVARGEVVVVEDRLGVTMTEIIKSDRT